MDIEGDVFRRKRFETDKLLRFGFTKTAGGYRCETLFMGGDFSAALFVSDAGKITGTVTDEMNKEEYRQLRMENQQGPYVSTVRARYTELLEQIAKECCIDVQFSSDQANRIAKRIGSAAVWSRTTRGHRAGTTPAACSGTRTTLSGSR